MILTVICEACREEIGRIDTEVITYPPWNPDQFMSVDDAHKAKPPFRTGVEWEYCTCPMGPHKPFVYPDRIKTDQGYYYVKDKTLLPSSPELEHSVREGIDIETKARMEAMANMSISELRDLRRPEVTLPTSLPTSGAPTGEESGVYSFSPDSSPPKFLCQYCNNQFKSKAGLLRHEVFCLRRAK